MAGATPTELKDDGLEEANNRGEVKIHTFKNVVFLKGGGDPTEEHRKQAN